MTDVKLQLLCKTTWNHWTVCKGKMNLGVFKNVTNKMFSSHEYYIYMYKEDCALNMVDIP